MGGVNTPVHVSSAFAYLDRGESPYPRYFNTPNQKVVVEKICALEGGADGVLFSSGMAAMSTSALTFLRSGDHAVVQEELYGGTNAFVRDLFTRLGIDFTFVATDAASIVEAINNRTRLVVIESPTNPLLSVLDIRAVAEVARARGVPTLIDNTFATPIFQNPLELGSMLSCTAARNTSAGIAISAAASPFPRLKSPRGSATPQPTSEEASTHSRVTSSNEV
jgi:cystathionine beta-lyase